MADITVKMDVDNSQAIRSLKQVQQQTAKVSDAFEGLRGAIAGIAVGAIVARINDMATVVTNLSRATGIGVGAVKAYGDAIAAQGGDLRGAVEDLTDLTKAIDDARKGNQDAQDSFRDVGISLQDLAKLSEEDILKKTIQGLATIQDASRRTTKSMELLGGEFKKVDIQGINAAMNGAGRGSGVNASAVVAAADAQRNLMRMISQFETAIMNLMEPLNAAFAKIDVEKFAKAVVEIGAAAGSIVALVSALKILGVALVAVAGMFAAFKIGLVALVAGVKTVIVAWKSLGQNANGILGVLVGGVVVLTSGLGKASDALFGVSKESIGFIDIARKIATAIAAIVVGFLLFKAGAVPAIIAVVGGLAKMLPFVGLVTGAIYALNAAIEMAFDVDILGSFFGGLGKIYDKIKSIMGFKSTAIKIEADDQSAAETKRLAEKNKLIADGAVKTKTVVDAQRGLNLEALKTIDLYRTQNRTVVNGLGLQISLIGRTEEQTERINALNAIYVSYQEQINSLAQRRTELQRAAANGTQEEKAAFEAFARVYETTVAGINTEYEKQRRSVEALLDVQMVLRAREVDRLRVFENITKQMERQAALGDAIRSANDQAVSVRFEASQIGQSGFEQQVANIKETARRAALEAGRTFSAAFETDGDGLSPQRAEEMSKGLDLIAEKYRAIADAQITNLEKSREWNTGWNEAFKNYVDNATNAANVARDQFNALTNAMTSAIDKFVDTGKFSFKDFTRSIIADMLKIELRAATMNLMKLMGGGGGGGSLLGSIGSWFSGFFADGGYIPPGKAGIVGEAGPEMIGGPATITPMHKVGGGGGGNTYITNNINAIDAKSVAQLFSENRRTLLGATEQARKELPVRMRG